MYYVLLFLLLLLLLIIIICYLHKLIINLITWRLSVKMVSLSTALLHFLTINEYWQIAAATSKEALYRRCSPHFAQ